MSRINIPLAQFALAEKLDLLEALWAELSAEPHAYPSPEWHEAVLADRSAALAAGKCEVSGWEEAKDRIRRTITGK